MIERRNRRLRVAIGSIHHPAQLPDAFSEAQRRREVEEKFLPEVFEVRKYFLQFPGRRRHAAQARDLFAVVCSLEVEGAKKDVTS